MSRKVIERNIAYDDEKNLYYVNMDYGRNWQGKRVKTAKTFKTKKEAITALKVFEADKAKRMLMTPAGETMESFGEYWLKFEKADIRATTKYTYSVTLNNHIIPYFKEKPLQKIGKEEIYKYFAHLRETKKLSPNTIRKHYDMLCGIFSSAVQTEKIFTSPMKTVRAPKPEPFENQIYNPGQIVELFKAADGDRTELAVHLAVYLGLRRGEICGLRWENVDLTGHECQEKSSKETYPTTTKKACITSTWTMAGTGKASGSKPQKPSRQKKKQSLRLKSLRRTKPKGC